MSIRLKLVILLFLIGLILGAHAVFFMQGYLKNERQIRIVGASLNDLYGVTRTRSAIITQIMRSMDYRFTGKEEDKKRFEEFEATVWRAQAEWRDAIRKSRELGQNKDEESDRAAHVQRIYKQVKKSIAKAFALANSGKAWEAYNLLETEVEPLTDHVLNDDLDEAVTREIREVDEAYEKALLQLGTMPWVGEKGIEQVRLARVFLSYFLIADQLLLNTRKQYGEILAHLVSGKGETKREFDALGVDVKNSFKEWFEAAQSHAKLGGKEKREVLRALEVEKHVNEFQEMAGRAFELKDGGKTKEVLQFFEKTLRPFTENILIKEISEELNRAKREIENAHRTLLSATLAAGAKAILLLAVASLLVVLFFIGMIRNIIVSLGKLRRGTEIVGSGELGHRIGLKSRDELGQLASSFDRMSQALQHSRDEMVMAKEYTQNILRSMNDMLVVISPKGIIKTVNDALCTLLGYTEDELVGQPVDTILPEGLPRRYSGTGERGGKMDTGSVERAYLTKTGSRIPVSLAGSVMRNDSGETEGIVWVAQDITQRKQWEESLLLSERKFRKLSQEFHTLLDAIPDALLLINPDLEVQWANKAATAVFSMEAAELIGRHCHALWYGNPAPCEDCHVQRSFRSRKEESAHRSTPDGKFWDVRAIPIKDEMGRVTYVINIAVDVTEKITLQAEAMQAAHLASLGELAAGVAHEINNPINSIINYAQILIDELSGATPCGEYAERILKEGDRISSIVRSLLSFARVFEEEKSDIHVDELLANSLSLSATQMKKEGIKLSVICPADLPEIEAHSQQIEQVFLNVISNARYALAMKYPQAHEDKALEISSERVLIDSCPFVRVTFFDRGTGIPPQILDKVVEPFFSTKPKGAGTGLGLSISHGIITDHGGRLKIDSIEGVCTRVTIDLPARRDC
ncbi:MAG: PAS domain S-box protein [Deltaproteobacteria bacterium]|nr:PAS domain S-box protein [Deltaproteobacteria bacterium]NIS78081.1 PAS domain S-box protein [Deltaproteobacteria bacterium]